MSQRFRSKTVRILQADNGEYSDTIVLPNQGQCNRFTVQARSVPPREGGDVVITDVSNASPAVVTSAGHGMVTGATVDTSGFTNPATAAGLNDNAITRIDDDTFSLDGIDTLLDDPYDGSTTARWSSDAASTMTYDVEQSADGINWGQASAGVTLNTQNKMEIGGPYVRVKANVTVDQQSDIEIVIAPLGNGA